MSKSINYSIYKRSVSPCRDCGARAVGCHATCELYAEWKKGEDCKRLQAIKEQAKSSVYIGYVHNEQKKRIDRLTK